MFFVPFQVSELDGHCTDCSSGVYLHTIVFFEPVLCFTPDSYDSPTSTTILLVLLLLLQFLFSGAMLALLWVTRRQRLVVRAPVIPPSLVQARRIFGQFPQREEFDEISLHQ
uniref:Uncharacterized protein n=1 Tax=Meloidogyne enterolobii TaxID=390850 RepID=A0A6V7U4V7_MELEN|nr:unnamed protein product [Meloidogyne enterolobii]